MGKSVKPHKKMHLMRDSDIELHSQFHNFNTKKHLLQFSQFLRIYFYLLKQDHFKETYLFQCGLSYLYSCPMNTSEFMGHE